MPAVDGYDGFYMRCPVVVFNQFVQFVKLVKFFGVNVVVLDEFIEFVQLFIGLSVRLSRRRYLPS